MILPWLAQSWKSTNKENDWNKGGMFFLLTLNGCGYSGKATYLWTHFFFFSLAKHFGGKFVQATLLLF